MFVNGEIRLFCITFSFIFAESDQSIQMDDSFANELVVSRKNFQNKYKIRIQLENHCSHFPRLLIIKLQIFLSVSKMDIKKNSENILGPNDLIQSIYVYQLSLKKFHKFQWQQ